MQLRALQLSVSIYILLILAPLCFTEVLYLEKWPQLIELIAFFAVAGFVAWNNLKFDWLHLKGYAFRLNPCRKVWPIVVGAVIAMTLFYAAMNLSVGYDSHLSKYYVTVQMPKAWWPEETQWAAELNLASTERGIYTLWFYIFMLSAFAVIYLSGFFSTPASQVVPVMSWSVFGSRVVLAGFGLVISVLLLVGAGNSALYIIREGNGFPELLLFVNVAPVVLATIHAMVMLGYSSWILFEGIRALRIRICTVSGKELA